MKIVAILNRSAGNDSVGEMWEETEIFEPETPVIDVINWACGRNRTIGYENFRANLKITVAGIRKVGGE